MKKIVEATSVDNTIATVMMAFADPNEDRDLSYNLKLAVASDPASVSSSDLASLIASSVRAPGNFGFDSSILYRKKTYTSAQRLIFRQAPHR